MRFACVYHQIRANVNTTRLSGAFLRMDPDGSEWIRKWATTVRSDLGFIAPEARMTAVTQTTSNYDTASPRRTVPQQYVAPLTLTITDTIMAAQAIGISCSSWD